MGQTASVPPPPPVEPGELVAGKYMIERAIAAGGMGIVYAARHVELDQSVALKFLRSELRGHISTSRFQLEARATAKLRSAHVAKVHDVGVLEDGTPFMVMELLDGIDLERLVEEQGRLAPDIAVELVLQACEAVSEAHAVGIIHRDLKPANFFLTKTPQGAPFVKVLDFGISKATLEPSRSATVAGTIMGSPPYMSPETLKSSRNADVRSDIWAIGVILYELVTGRLPFDGEGVGDLALKVHHETPLWPMEIDPDIPAAYDAIVRRCLEKDPTKRYASIRELETELKAFSSERGVSGMTLSLRTSHPGIVIADDEPPPPTPRTLQRNKVARAATTVASKIHSDPPPKKKRSLTAPAIAGVAIAIGIAIVLGRPKPAPSVVPETAPAAAPIALAPPSPVGAADPAPPPSAAPVPTPEPVAAPPPTASTSAAPRKTAPPSTRPAVAVAAKAPPAEPPPPPVAAPVPAPPPTPSAAPIGKLRDRGF